MVHRNLGDWPGGVEPVVQTLQVAYTERSGQPVALVRLVDELGDHLDIEVSEKAAWAAMVGFTHFLRQAHRGIPCTGCARPPDEHPNDVCDTWH